MAQQNPETPAPMHMRVVRVESAAHDRHALCRRSVRLYGNFFLESAAPHMRYVFL